MTVKNIFKNITILFLLCCGPLQINEAQAYSDEYLMSECRKILPIYNLSYKIDEWCSSGYMSDAVFWCDEDYWSSLTDGEFYDCVMTDAEFGSGAY